MHYIRLLRPPHVNQLGHPGSSLGLVLTITTDLGESFFSPNAPVKLAVELFVETVEKVVDQISDDDDDDEKPCPKRVVQNRVIELPLVAASTPTAGRAGRASKPQKFAAAAGSDASSWRAGMHVLKVEARLLKDAEDCLWGTPLRPSLTILKRRICIRTADKKLSVAHAQQLVESSSLASGYKDGLIMPLWLDVPDTANEDFPRVALRRLLLHKDVATSSSRRAACVEVEEDIGESIARHVWDAGLVAVAFLADACLGLSLSPKRPQEEQFKDDQNASLAKDLTLPEALRSILLTRHSQVRNKCLRVLELGSGVGILGIGLATIVQEARQRNSPSNEAYDHDAMFLLTDLPEAEQHARANMARSGCASLVYENFDWEDGRKGCFGPAVAGKTGGTESDGNAWDLVVLSDCTYNVDMLPALVETLVALSCLNNAQGAHEPRVLIARKPRHDSEEAFFSLMADHGWTVLANAAVPLPVLYGDAEVVELYLYERARR
ncbi:hypothetical protein SEPCBS57363_002805 [Sporothrix epigloea]|uniref:Uncharacterized protein n=1 Tax=Sporothrix epigloea TaxID=1892477 RepID=A0ABP0DI52_9PEZI